MRRGRPEVGQTTVSSFAYGYDLLDQRTSAVCADNAFWSYQYDALGQVISGKKQWADNSLVAGQQFQYSFDSIGNRTQTKTGGGPVGQGLHTASYTPDLLNRYQSREVPGYVPMLGTAVSNAAVSLWSSAGQYGSTSRHGEYFSGEVSVTNGSGPIWVAITNLAVLNNGTNLDKVTSSVGNALVPPTPESFAYDPDGNLTNNGLWGISWDAENRAKSFQSRAGVPVAGKRKVDCTYDYAWRRVEKIVSTNNGSGYVAVSTNRFVYDGWNLAAVLDGANNPVLSFAWGSDASGTMRGAGGVGGLVAMKVHSGTNAGTYFYVYDGNCNVVALVNAADGSIVAQYEYGPFGELLRATGQLAQVNPFLFSTKFYDWETGFYYYGYRYYDAGTGRWLSRDPMEEDGGANLYAFVSNGGWNRVDYLGLDEITAATARAELLEESDDETKNTVCYYRHVRDSAVAASREIVDSVPYVSDAAVLVTGKTLSGQEGSRPLVVAGMAIGPVAKLFRVCKSGCNRLMICVTEKVLKRPKLISLAGHALNPTELAYKGIIMDSKIAKVVPVGGPGHPNLAQEIGALVDPADFSKGLKDGCYAFTVVYKDGRWVPVGSGSFGGSFALSDEARKIILENLK